MVFCRVPYLFLLVELYGGTMRFMVQGEFAIKYNEKEKKMLSLSHHHSRRLIMIIIIFTFYNINKNGTG